jgi:hypothetical protein
MRTSPTEPRSCSSTSRSGGDESEEGGEDHCAAGKHGVASGADKPRCGQTQEEEDQRQSRDELDDLRKQNHIGVLLVETAHLRDWVLTTGHVRHSRTNEKQHDEGQPPAAGPTRPGVTQLVHDGHHIKVEPVLR